MEETGFCECHCHSILITCRNHLFVCHGPTWLGDKFNAKFRRMVDGVSEWEESVGRDGDIIESTHKFSLFLLVKLGWLVIEICQPLLIFRSLHIALNITHSCVHPILSLHAVLECQI